MSGRVAHFDADSGAAGDMILAALVDAGAPLAEVRRALATMPLPSFGMEVEEVRSRGFRALRLRLELPDEHRHRGLADVKAILRAGRLAADALRDAERVFERLAEAEARAHGIPVEKVHFHEVGALDAIVDVAGACVALRLLDASEVTFSPLRVGGGYVASAHGRLPVPAPAVLELTRGVPIVREDVDAELLTPTGAAILTTLGRPAPSEPFTADGGGTGAGTRELPDRANVLRVSVGRYATRVPAPAVPWESDEIVVLETNLDDMSPESLPHILERALSSGALDAFLTPILMKKGRPGHVLTVLVEPERAKALASLLFRETTTFGIRRSACPRWKLARESREIESPWGPVRVKVGELGEGRQRISPEYESCREIADRTGVPLREIFETIEHLLREKALAPRGPAR
ncbi:MAG: nickel pincer cofactor biosynthesis protein LarC [bacterium]